MSDPYSSSRVARGALSLIVGKAVTSIAGIGSYVLLVRELPVEQFAAYSILFGLVALLEVVTGVGLMHALSRYVPELFVTHRHGTLRRLVWRLLVLRFAVLVVIVSLLYVLAPAISPRVGLDDAQWALRGYLAVALVRITAFSLFSVLESMLHQAIAQTTFSAITVTRFILFMVFAGNGALDLETVIVIELGTDLAGCLVLLTAMVWVMPREERGSPSGSNDWIRSNLRRMTGFATKGYLQHLLILPYGGSVNRLLVGGTLPIHDVALFGFGQSVADLMERYLPLKLFAGVIRPVLTARYAAGGTFADLSTVANLLFKLNASLLCLGIVILFAGRQDVLAKITAGKYTAGGVELLILMSVLVLAFSLRHMLDHVCHAVERNGPLIWSNSIIMLSIVPGVAMLPTLGVFALPVANLAGVIIGIVVLVWRLRRDGFDYRPDTAGLAKLVTATCISLAAVQAAYWLAAEWLAATAVGLLSSVAAMALLRVFAEGDRRLLKSMIRRR